VEFKWISEIFTLYKQLMLILGCVTVIVFCDVLGEVIPAVLRHYSRHKLGDLFM